MGLAVAPSTNACPALISANVGCLILDSGPAGPGVATLARLRQWFPAVGVIVLGSEVTVDAAVDYGRLGVLGVLKDIEAEQVAEIVARACDWTMTQKRILALAAVDEGYRLENASEICVAAARSLWNLTVRQVTVLEALLRGESNKEIAVALGTSEKNVEFHITRLLAKASLSTTKEMICACWRAGLEALLQHRVTTDPRQPDSGVQ